MTPTCCRQECAAEVGPVDQFGILLCAAGHPQPRPEHGLIPAAEVRPHLPTANGRTPSVNSHTPAVEPAQKIAECQLPRFARTDSGNAELVAHLYGERTRFDHRQRRWLLR